MEPTNEDRARRASRAVAVYAMDEYGFGEKGPKTQEWLRNLEPDHEAAIQDLITDLMHLTDSLGIKQRRLREMFWSARNNYEEETEGAEPWWC